MNETTNLHGANALPAPVHRDSSIADAEPTADDVLAYWRAAGPQRWFAPNADFDADFGQRFLALHLKAARRECAAWLESAGSALALVLLLDQFPRNVYRGTGHMVATDPLARLYARRAIAVGHDQDTEIGLRIFFYLPFAHSEDLHDQDLSVERHLTLGPGGARHALQHRDIVQRFGRFPHRNAMLARDSTTEEEAFLRDGGFAG